MMIKKYPVLSIFLEFDRVVPEFISHLPYFQDYFE